MAKIQKPSDGKGGDFADAYGNKVNDSNPFVPCPEGTHNAVLVDFVDMGYVEQGVYQQPGKTHMVHCCKLVFQVDEKMPDGRPFIVSTSHFGAKVSLHEKSKLRAWLQGIIGRPFEVGDDVDGIPDEDDYKRMPKGVAPPADVPALIGMPCTVGVAHALGGKNGDKVFANIVSIAKHMKKLPILSPEGYVRVKDRGASTDAAVATAQAGGFEADEDSLPF